MKAAKIDRSGIFDGVATTWAKPPAPIKPGRFQLSARGLTFHSAARIAPWTEMEVELELPASKPRRLQCRGVIVQCESSPHQSGYDITLLFLDLNKRALAEIQKASSQWSQWTAPQRSVTLSSAQV